MKKSLLIWLSIFQIILCFNACTNDRDMNRNINYSGAVIEVSNFPVNFNLKGKNVGPTSFFSNPTDIVADSNYYLVFDTKNKKIFNLLNNKYELINSFGMIGEGPGYFPEKPKIIKNSFIKERKLLLYQFSFDIIEMNLESEKNKFMVSSSVKKSINDRLQNVQQIENIGKNRYVGLGGMLEGKLYFFNLDSTRVSVTPFVPKTNPGPKTREDFMFMYNGKIGVNKEKEKIVIANHYFNQLEIYDYNGKLLKEIRIGNLDSPFSKQSGNTKFHYVNVDVTEKYIFAIYLGKTPSLGLDDLFGAKAEIHVFNWDGKPIAKLLLDRVIGAISVNSKKGIILSVDDFKNERQRLLEYKLPKELL